MNTFINNQKWRYATKKFDTTKKISNENLEAILSRPDIYRKLKLFPKEFSALRLAATARRMFEKFKNDYKVCGFYLKVIYSI